jgi:hypothetical protein
MMAAENEPQWDETMILTHYIKHKLLKPPQAPSPAAMAAVAEASPWPCCYETVCQGHVRRVCVICEWFEMWQLTEMWRDERVFCNRPDKTQPIEPNKRRHILLASNASDDDVPSTYGLFD